MSEEKKDAFDRIAETEQERALGEELDAIEREGEGEDDAKARAKMRDIVANATRPKSNVIQARWRFRVAVAAGVVAAAAAAIILANRSDESDVPVASPRDAGGETDAGADR